ncbi:MAG: metallophosphoesterase family protein [Candidatus Diapherotrites archaeon]|nr:metallophosphoesterase family protein [Candidatus Diapherotrites archaeon]
MNENLVSLTFKEGVRKVKEIELNQDPFVISDFHLNHKNIILYSNRPFTSIEEMNNSLIQNWNNIVEENDLVIFVGDLFLGHKKELEKWLSLLKGKIIFIKGNHDSKSFNALKELIITFRGQRFFVTHNPKNNPFDWQGWMIHGHCHNKNPEKYPLVNQINKTINVSCELTNYTPMRLSTILKQIKNE